MMPLITLTLIATLTTVAEQSSYVNTGRYDEVVRLCGQFEKGFPDRARCRRFGTTPEGRPMLALVASADGTLDADLARARHRPVVLIQGGIHAGEIDGKDAGLWLLRDLLVQSAGKVPGDLLRQVVVVFVPVFNVDGHERFSAHNRPNQNGPAEMGFRVTSQNLNLNRDYMKADAPEMAAMLRLLTQWDPLVYVDLHVTDGADFQHDVSMTLEPRFSGPRPLRHIGAGLLATVLKGLTTQGHLPVGYYPSFVKDDDPTSGFAQGVAPPRFSTSYWALHNRWSVLVETHSWKDYRTRVRATHDALLGCLGEVARHGADWLAAATAADEVDRRLGGQPVPLRFEHTDKASHTSFLGYAYAVEPSAASGALRVRYDRRQPRRFEVPLFDEVLPTEVVVAPQGGYVIPAAYAALVADKLRLHGLSFITLDRGRPAVPLSAFRVSEAKFRDGPTEGRLTVQVKGTWRPETHAVPAGSLYVPVGQRAGALAMHLLEPTAPDSLLSWGFFNAALEQKEYMESYVAEAVAQELLAKDVMLRAEFVHKLASEADFARDPAARLRFFHQHHPSWDSHYRLYPIYRVDSSP